jgi:hypothetical protein
MASLDDMVSQLPMDQIAQALGVDEATAAAATKKAIPALVQGMQANATSDPAKAAALAKAIAAHAQQAAAASATAAAGAATGTAGAIDISNVDTADGEKIVGHVFGDNTEQVTNQLGGLVGGADLFKKLLPMLAPLVMGFLAKNLGGGGGGGGSGSGTSGGGGGGGLGGLLSKIMSMFGGGSKSATGSTTAAGGSDDLGGLLGGLLGGAGGDIGDALGGLLGGGSK